MKTAKELLRKYENNKKALVTVDNDYEKYKVKKRTKATLIKNKLEKRMNALETKMEAIDNKITNEIGQRREKKDNTLTRLNMQILKFEKTVEMLKLKVDDVTIDDTDVRKDQNFQDRHFQWVDGYLFDDKFLKIRLLICESYKRQLCKYAVLSVGKTSFARYMNSSDMQIKTYGYHVHDGDASHLSFMFAVRHFSSLEKAEKWIKRNKNKILIKNKVLSNIIYEYKKFKAKYMTVVRNYRKKDNLMELIEAREMAEKL